MKTITSIIFITFLYVFQQAKGTTMEYTFSGAGTGQLGVSQFANAQFTITARADTAEISSVAPYITQILVESAAVEVEGFYLGQFEIGLRVFHSPYVTVPPGSFRDETIGLSLATGPDLLDLFHTSFRAYDLVTDLGPVFVPVPQF